VVGEVQWWRFFERDLGNGGVLGKEENVEKESFSEEGNTPREGKIK